MTNPPCPHSLVLLLPSVTPRGAAGSRVAVGSSRQLRRLSSHFHTAPFYRAALSQGHRCGSAAANEVIPDHTTEFAMAQEGKQG